MKKHFEKIALAVFDLDGTLTDTFGDLCAAVNHARSLLGRDPHSIEFVKSCVGNGVHVLTQKAVLEGDEREDEVLVEQQRQAVSDYYCEHYMDTTTIYPGVEKVLSELQERGIPLAVLTNKPQVMTDPMLTGLGLAKYFNYVIGALNGFPHKPDPTSLNYLIEQAGAAPETSIMIGDGPADVQVALNARVNFIGLSYGTETAESLKGFGAEIVVDDFDELLNYLK